MLSLPRAQVRPLVGELRSQKPRNAAKQTKKPTIKLLKENIELKLQNIEFGNDFLDMAQNAQATKEKIGTSLVVQWQGLRLHASRLPWWRSG